jgi:predicted transcriptional regulator
MKHVTAEEIMIPLEEYPHLPYWFTLRQAMAELIKTQIDVNGRSSLPRRVLVFDEESRLLGVVRRRDIMRGLEPRFAKGTTSDYPNKLFDVSFDPNLLEVLIDQGLESMRKRAEDTVEAIIQPIHVTVEHADHILKIMHEMVAHDVSMIPVLKDDTVVGVVRSVEVFQQVARVVLGTE